MIYIYIYVYYTVGELVYNLSLKETVFLVFDVLAVAGRPTLQLPFKERMEIVRRYVYV
jgi:ATP-dependent DNA ligase